MAKKAKGRRAPTRTLVAALTVAFLSLSISTLVIVSGFQIFFYVQSQQNFVARQQELVAREAAKTFAGFIQEQFSALEAATRVGAPISASPAERERIMGYLLGLKPSFRRLVLLDAEGQQLTEASRRPQFVEENLLARMEGNWLDMVRRGERYISPVYIDEVTSEPMVVLAIPLTNVFGDFQGVLATEVNLKFMWDLVYKLEVGKGGQAYVVDRQGNLLAAGDISRVLRGEKVTHLKEVSEFINSSARVDENGAGISRGIDGTMVLATYVPLGVPDWAVVTEIPIKEAYRSAINSVIISLSVLAAVVALAGVLSARLARQLSAPLLDLASVASRIAEGELGLQATGKGPAEAMTLAEAFNRMTAQLHELIGNLEQQVDARTAALARRAAALEAAAYVARQAAGIRDVNSLLNETVHLISDRFGFYHAGIFLIDEAGEYAVLQAASSEGGQRMLARGHKLRVGQVGIVGYVASSGEPRIALDVGEDAVYFDNPDLPATRSEMALPLKVRDRVIGVLDVQSTEAGAFSDEDVAVLQTMADQLAIAIENARLLEESERALRELETLYGLQVRDSWREYTTTRPLAYRYTSVSIEPTPPRPVEIPAPHPTIVEQDGTRQLIAPIRLRGETIGVVTFRQDKASGEKPWSEEELALVEELCTQIGLALENARLLEETRQRAVQERILANITARVRASLDPETILQTALRELGMALGADRVFVRLGGTTR